MSQALPGPAEIVALRRPRCPWWVAVPLARSFWAWRAARREGALGRGAARAIVPAIAFAFFVWVGTSVGQEPAGGAATILLLFQFTMVMANIPGRSGRELLVEPEGPPLPYRPVHLVVIWGARVLGPLSAALGLAYGGLVLGSPRLTAADGVLAWAADSAGLASGILGYAVARWLLGTFLPVGVRKALLLFWDVFFRNLGALVLACFFAVAAQYAVTRVFISPKTQEAIASVAAAVTGDPARRELTPSVESVRRLTRARPVSLMSLVLRDPATALSWRDAGWRFALAAAILPLLLWPARRPEEPTPAPSSHRLGERVHDLLAAAMPLRWRLPARLCLPSVGESVAFIFPAGAMLFGTALAFALHAADIAAGRTPRPLPHTALTGFGYALGALSALSLGPVLRRLGLQGTSYAQLCALPVDVAVLVRRMGLFCLVLLAAQQLAVGIVWALLWGRSWAHAALFAATVAVLVAGGCAGAAALQSTIWRASPSARGTARAAWAFALGSAMLLPYHFVDAPPAVFGYAVAAETLLAVGAALWMHRSLGAMAREREPSCEE